MGGKDAELTYNYSDTPPGPGACSTHAVTLSAGSQVTSPHIKGGTDELKRVIR